MPGVATRARRPRGCDGATGRSSARGSNARAILSVCQCVPRWSYLCTDVLKTLRFVLIQPTIVSGCYACILHNVVHEGFIAMARRIRNSDLETREVRRKLKIEARPHWCAIGLGLHLGYRKSKTRAVWVVRRYLGGQSYKVETIALADDTEDADGTNILTFWQAQSRAREMRAPGTRGGSFTVAEAVAYYLSNQVGDRPSAPDSKARLTAHVIPPFGDKPVNELDADKIRAWHKALANKPARVRSRIGGRPAHRAASSDPERLRKRQVSANRVLALFKAALNCAWNNDKVTCDRVWSRVKPFRGVDIPRARYLTLAECQRLINACDPEFRTLVQAALQTGACYQELSRLRVSDFNRDVGTVHVRKSKAARDRHVVQTEEGRAFFGQLAAGRPGHEPLLGREWRPSHQSLPMKAACGRAHIEGASFHALRHTWASLSVMAGVPLMVVAKNLGHVDTRMVERHYGHLAPSFVADAIRAGAPRFGMVEPSNVRGL
jgi:integrase